MTSDSTKFRIDFKLFAEDHPFVETHLLHRLNFIIEESAFN